MTKMTGSAMVISWIHPAGTVTLSTDYRSLASSPSVGLVDATAGSDADKVYLKTQKDGSYSYRGIMSTGGTAIEDALVEGTYGTLIISPEGTATGKRKETVTAFSQGAKLNWPYDNVCEISCDFQKSGARTLGTW